MYTYKEDVNDQGEDVNFLIFCKSHHVSDEEFCENNPYLNEIKEVHKYKTSNYQEDDKH